MGLAHGVHCPRVLTGVGRAGRYHKTQAGNVADTRQADNRVNQQAGACGGQGARMSGPVARGAGATAAPARQARTGLGRAMLLGTMLAGLA
ncbi:hypothetical protein, partial [Acetobacter fabarum]